MKIKKTQIILTGIFVLFLCWMACSTNIIAWERNRGVPIVEGDSCDIKTFGFAFYEIDENGVLDIDRRIEIRDDIFDTVSGAGYMYCVTPDTSEELNKTIIFSSNEKTYEMIPGVTRLKWVGNYYVDIDPTPQSYSGFEFDFCPLSFKKGDYQIYLQSTHPDGTIAATVDTGYHLIRKFGKTEIEFRPSERIEKLTDYEGWANSGLESIRRDEEGNLMIKGWGILDGINADETNCIIEVFDENGYVETYTTLPRTITYINDYFESDLYYSSGFIAKVPQFSGSELKVNIYVEHEGTIYACGYGFESNGDFSEFNSYSRTDLI